MLPLTCSRLRSVPVQSVLTPCPCSQYYTEAAWQEAVRKVRADAATKDAAAWQRAASASPATKRAPDDNPAVKEKLASTLAKNPSLAALFEMAQTERKRKQDAK